MTTLNKTTLVYSVDIIHDRPINIKESNFISAIQLNIRQHLESDILLINSKVETTKGVLHD